MTRQEARRRALWLAWQYMEAAISSGVWDVDTNGAEVFSVADAVKVERALNDIAQGLFERYERATDRAQCKGGVG